MKSYPGIVIVRVFYKKTLKSLKSTCMDYMEKVWILNTKVVHVDSKRSLLVDIKHVGLSLLKARRT